ncbi:MAG TPA: hypothetical protein VEJ63_22450, partial [Planctomycetota bacterium]|nr:hypothetical protein [Planctomycetota bacterium]
MRITPADRRPSHASTPAAVPHSHAPLHTPVHRPVHDTATAMRHSTAAQESSSGLMIGGIVAAVVMIGAAVLLLGGGTPNKPKPTTTITETTMTESPVKPQPASGAAQNSSTPGHNKPLGDPGAPVSIAGPGLLRPNGNDPEQQASAAFDDMKKKFDALPEKETDARKKLLEDYIAAWPQAIVTGRARQMLNPDKAETAPSVPTPPQPLTSVAALNIDDVFKAATNLLAGAKLEGFSKPEALLDGNFTQYDGENGYAFLNAGETGTVTLKQPEMLNCIRLLNWDKDARRHQYKLEICSVKDEWSTVVDLKQLGGSVAGWSYHRFPDTVVKQIRLNAQSGTAASGNHVTIVELQGVRLPQVKPPAEDELKNVANVAAASAGTTAAGGEVTSAVNDGKYYDYTYATGFMRIYPQHQLILTLNAEAPVNCVRLLNWDLDERWHQYKIETCGADGFWSTAVDLQQANQKSSGWALHGFAERLVKQIRVTMQNVYNPCGNFLCLVEVQAYKAPASVLASAPVPVAAVLQVPGLPPIGTILIQETFDDPNAENIGHATIGDGPAGASGKVACLKGALHHAKVGLVNWFKRPNASPRNFDYKPAENTRVRARYFSENGRDIEWLIHIAAEPDVTYRCDAVAEKGKWAVSEVPLSEFKTEAGKKLPPGATVTTTLFALGVSTDNNPIKAYVDEITVYNPGAPAATAATPRPAGTSGIVFVNKDEKRGGNWKADLGKAGYVIFCEKAATGNATDHSTKLPPFITSVENDGVPFRWGESAEIKALENSADGGQRTATCMHSTTEVKMRITAKDLTPYRLSVYCIDFDKGNRAQRVEALSDTGNVVHTFELSSFSDGVWLHYNVKGSCILKFVNTAGRMNALVSAVLFDEDKEAIAVAQAAKAEDGFAGYQAGLADLLAKRDAQGLQIHIAKAQKDEALKKNAAQIQDDAKLATLLAGYGETLAAAAEKLKNVDSFEVKLARGESMLVGKKGKFQVQGVKDGSLMLATQGAQVPVGLDTIDRSTRDALILTQSESAATRTLLLLMKLADGDKDATLAMARKALKDAEAAAAPEAPALARCLELIAKRAQDAEARESAAAAEWRELQKLVDTKKWKNAESALQSFKKSFEGTKFAALRAHDIKTAAAKIEENARLERGLVGWWKLDEAKGEIAADSSGHKNHGKLEKGALWIKGKLDAAVQFD